MVPPGVRRRFTQTGSLLAALVLVNAAPVPVSASMRAGNRVALVRQAGEPTVDRNSIDTHLVHFGTMPLRARANGFIIDAGDHPVARVMVLRQSIPHIKIGDKASVRIFIRDAAVSGTIAKIGTAGPGPRVPVEIAMSSPLPQGTMVDDDVNVTIDYGRVESTAYLVWGDSMKENSDGVVFRMEPDGKHATRVNVRFGDMAAELIQIKSGLALGDRVIISDLTKYNAFPRIRIE